jgi:hypothetical protein
MTLNRIRLQSDFRAAFDKAKNDTSSDAEATMEMLCHDLAVAIEGYVKGGDVIGVEVAVAVVPSTAAQSKKGKVV